MKNKLSRIKTPWRRNIVGAFLSALIFIGIFHSPRAKAHWIGNRNRPSRLERPLLFLLIPAAILILEPQQFVLWSIIWGGAFSLFTIVESVRKTAQFALSAIKGDE